MNEQKVDYKELKLVDSDQWKIYQKQIGKPSIQKKNTQTVTAIIDTLAKTVGLRMNNSIKIDDDDEPEQLSLSKRRSSRLSGKKKKNYSEDADNYNLYLLLELMKLDLVNFTSEGN